MRIQKVSWIDPERDSFVAGPIFTARIRDASFYRYELDPEDFARSGATALDPMSNVAYRVILLRLDEERLLFRALTVALVALFILAGIAAGWALVKKPGVPVYS